MAQTIARVKKSGKHFEILVDMDLALKYKKGESSIVDFLEADRIFRDSKKGDLAPSAEIDEAFGTEDVYEVAGKIVKDGEIMIDKEHRDADREKKIKQVVDFLARNSVDPRSGNPHTPDRIRSALEQAHVNIKNKSVDSQINEIIDQIVSIIPIKIATKKIKITIPAIHTGRSYGVITDYKESENWLPDGSLEVVVNIPAGIVIDFYDKLNNVTHGSALAEEIGE